MLSTERKSLPAFDTDLHELLPFARIRLVAFDLDGTLIAGELVERAQSLIRSARAYGVRTTVATGRTLGATRGLLRNLGLTNTPVVLYNGAIVLRNSTFDVLAADFLDRGTLVELLDCAMPLGLTTYAFFHADPKRVIMPSGAREFIYAWGSELNGPTTLFGLPITWKGDTLTPFDPTTVLLTGWGTDKIRDDAIARLGAIAGLTVTSSGGTFLEVRPAGVSKATALEKVCRTLQMDRSEVLVVGDNDNDQEMLDWAGIGVSVSTASAGALAASDFVCQYGPFQGAIEALQLVRNARRYFPELRVKHGKR